MSRNISLTHRRGARSCFLLIGQTLGFRWRLSLNEADLALNRVVQMANRRYVRPDLTTGVCVRLGERENRCWNDLQKLRRICLVRVVWDLSAYARKRTSTGSSNVSKPSSLGLHRTSRLLRQLWCRIRSAQPKLAASTSLNTDPGKPMGVESNGPFEQDSRSIADEDKTGLIKQR
jgi:hypothetical protein